MRIGIFGGTFNPPHLGHMLLAQAAFEGANLDRLIFMPCAVPPHKAGMKIPDGEHRYNMVKLAIQGNPWFELSDMEIEAGGKSYTAKTLESLEKLYPDDRLCLIVGADSFCDMEKWFCPGEIFKRAEIIVAHRGGMKTADLNVAIDLFRQKYDACINVVQMPVMELSSSDIRDRIACGKPICYMVCNRVIDYIERQEIYKEDE